jgi:hypothetical protein
MSGTHSRLSPSAAEAWMNCPGYPAAIDGLPNPSTEFAAEGTMAHGFRCLPDARSRAIRLHRHDDAGRGVVQFTWTDEDADYWRPASTRSARSAANFSASTGGPVRVARSRPVRHARPWHRAAGSNRGQRSEIRPRRPRQPRAEQATPPLRPRLLVECRAPHHKATDFLFIIDQPRCPVAAASGAARSTSSSRSARKPARPPQRRWIRTRRAAPARRAATGACAGSSPAAARSTIGSTSTRSAPNSRISTTTRDELELPR